MRIGIATDHSGVKLKSELIAFLQSKHYDVINYGTDTVDSVDYSDYAFKIGEEVRDKHIDLGILICRTGIGMSIACNKVKMVRCAKVNNIHESEMARKHNNANVIAINSDMNLDLAKEIVDTFINTPFLDEERHLRRVQKIDNY